MSRYYLFGGEETSFLGGWGDFRGAFGTVTDALKDAQPKLSWFEITDSATCDIVCSKGTENRPGSAEQLNNYEQELAFLRYSHSSMCGRRSFWKNKYLALTGLSA